MTTRSEVSGLGKERARVILANLNPILHAAARTQLPLHVIGET